MAPTPTLANEVADAILVLCEAIDNVALPNTFYTKPPTVRRLLQPSALSIDARPLIGIQVGNFRDQLATASGALLCIVRNTPNASSSRFSRIRDMAAAKRPSRSR